ncbi:hypothetical protein ERO13_A03G147450v2, partial [Gossypium hirsutum]
IGDFNAILSGSDKVGGRLNGKHCSLFGDSVDSLALQDFGFKGPTFTWQRGRVFERLDQAIGNDEWIKAFP